MSDRVLVGIPADTLRRRPDVRAAERRIAAETARVGVAVAHQFPTLTLSGSVGIEALIEQMAKDVERTRELLN